MRDALRSLLNNQRPPLAMDFEAVKTAVGFPEYFAEEAKYNRNPPA
jgi:hypothetical protein